MEQWGIASSNIDVDAAASPARAHRGGVEEGGREYGLPGHRSSNGSNDRLLQKEVNISLLKILTRGYTTTTAVVWRNNLESVESAKEYPVMHVC